MSEVYVISKGTGADKKFFEGDGDWAKERIDAREYETKQSAETAITNWSLDTVAEINSECAYPNLSLKR